MEFGGFLGNEALRERLSAAAAQGRLSHCCAICGPEGSGRHTLATAIAAAMQCTGAEPPCGRCPACKKVFAGLHPDVIACVDEKHKLFGVDMARAISNGARGAQAKESPTEDLVDAIRTVAAGGTAISPEIEQFIREDPPPATLTERQLEILKSAARGLSNKDIAKQFGISPVSVKKHLTVIFAKLGAATRAEASVIAMRKNLLKQ